MDRNETTPSTVSPKGNVTQVVFVSHEDVTELTIIVWTVGGVLLITLLILLGRIILARKKDPFTQMAYQRHRNSLFRIRIDSEYFTPTHVPSFSVSPDTTHLVIPSTASESPSHQRNHSNSCASRSHLSQRSFTPENNLLSQSTPTTDICENSEICVQNNVIVDSAQLNTCAQISTDSPNGQEMVSSFSHNNRRLSISISTSDQLPVINNTHHENSEIQRNQSTSDTVASGTINRQSLPNEIAGSRATLTNGVVISPPRYNDVIKTATRLPSVIVSRPSRSAPRHILFSL